MTRAAKISSAKFQTGKGAEFQRQSYCRSRIHQNSGVLYKSKNLATPATEDAVLNLQPMFIQTGICVEPVC